MFRLVGNGIELIETAPGVDVRKDILDRMAFRPQISRKVKIMPDVFILRG